MTIMHNDYHDLLMNNRAWAREKKDSDAGYFDELSMPQHPRAVIIGCSDSRVPLTSITGSEPGELFVHRNIANQVNLTDMNLLSFLEYAVEVLKIEHVIVLGHYKCGGVRAAVDGLDQEDVVENWISQISDLYHYHRKELSEAGSREKMLDKLSELNVVAQIKNLLRTPIIQRAFRKGKKLYFHGWIFDIHEGLLHELKLPLEEWKEYDLLPQEYSF